MTLKPTPKTKAKGAAAFQSAPISDALDAAQVLGGIATCEAAAAREADYGVDADERDELHDEALAKQFRAHGITPEMSHFARILRRGCAAAASRGYAGEALARRVRFHYAERARRPDLLDAVAAEVVASVARWHIAYQVDGSDRLAGVTIQGWRPSTRFTGKPQGEFIVLRWSLGREYGGDWSWPLMQGNVACTQLPSVTLKTRDAVVLAALRATAFDAPEDERELRAALCEIADVRDPAATGVAA